MNYDFVKKAKEIIATIEYITIATNRRISGKLSAPVIQGSSAKSLDEYGREDKRKLYRQKNRATIVLTIQVYF